MITNEELLQRCKTHLEYGIDTVTPIEEDFNELFLRFEKQIPKKSIRGKYNLVQCVNGHNVPCVCKENEMPYCPFCGQAIDWRDE